MALKKGGNVTSDRAMNGHAMNGRQTSLGRRFPRFDNPFVLMYIFETFSTKNIFQICINASPNESNMKAFNELTYHEKVGRFRKLARVALDAYGLIEAHFKLVRVAGNVVFRVSLPNPARIVTANEPYEDGQYLLRIHDLSEQLTDAIEVEMEWLAAICSDTELPVPKPIPNMVGSFVTRCSIPGIPGERDCTLLRWLKGRHVTRSIRPCHFLAQGRAMAQLHNHAAIWKPPKSPGKRRFDYDGLFKNDAGAGFPNNAVWPLLPNRCLQPYEVIANKTKRVMNDWGNNPEVYGLIHGDCGVDANVLFWKGNAHIIDFDGSGFGYYMFDLALALEHCWDEEAYPLYLDALLKGYTEFRTVPDEQLKHLNLFRSAFYVYMGLWTIAMDQTYPNSPHKADRHKKWLEYGLRFIRRYLDGH